jgi:leucine-rich repeat/coiled-coil domain-containing protein 1
MSLLYPHFCTFTMHLADELEKRNVLEEQTHVDMQRAITEAQEEAHRHVEEGYKEASQAVAKAM